MPVSYAVSYLLLAAVGVLGVVCLVRLLRAWWVRPAADRAGSASSEPTFRRCEECSARWRATERDRPSAGTLRRRRARRRLRRAVTGATTSRLPASWDRCPHCLSSEVRASRQTVRQR